NAVKQYKYDRKPYDSKTRKKEPLLNLGRGALVHFAVGENEIYMTTQLAGEKTRFLPFNKGKDGLEAGNSMPEDGSYPISYFWDQILQKETLIDIVYNYIHYERKEVEDENGKIDFKTSMIFPRFHQWDAVTKLLQASYEEGPGQAYLIQHSAGSGKSNSIAWLAHQLSNLYKDDQRVFDTVIVITDRKVLDDQLQDTIFQFEHKKGVVTRIGHKDEVSGGSKSQQLAKHLMDGTNIVIVTIQTFPFVVDAIRQETSLKDRKFAVIADEAHSSQSGKGAAKLKLALHGQQVDDEEVSAEDFLTEYMNTRSRPSNMSYYAFTATPKAKTLEIFGRCPDPDMPISEDNKPAAFHLYSMRQAIQEGFIVNVLKNYTQYKVLYELMLNTDKDQKVDQKKAKKEIAQFARLHPHNISQKIQ
ncbi:MAG: type I restriction endonuclease subunit R, partial [Deltaproteobacteria bacterium]|nr:type I restriction endonuclease subunit R [Deltaproteobacteria bacterium]